MSHRYTLTEALAVVVDQIDGEDPNTDAYADLLDPLRQLLEDLILLAESAHELILRSAEEEYLETSDALDLLRGVASLGKDEDDLAEVMGYGGQAGCDCETGLCERCASEFVEMGEPTALTNGRSPYR